MGAIYTPKASQYENWLQDYGFEIVKSENLR